LGNTGASIRGGGGGGAQSKITPLFTIYPASCDWRGHKRLKTSDPSFETMLLCDLSKQSCGYTHSTFQIYTEFSG